MESPQKKPSRSLDPQVIYGANEQATIGVARLLVEKATAGILFFGDQWEPYWNIWKNMGTPWEKV